MSAERLNLTIFDADRTLFEGPSTVWALAHLSQLHLLDTEGPLLQELEALRVGSGKPVEFISRVGKALPQLLEAVPEQSLADAAASAAERWEERIFPEMQPQIDQARERGPFLVISYGPDVFIRAFAKRLGALGARGRTPAEYTGQKPDKLTLAREACQEAHIVWGAPGSHLTVFGDAMDDVPLLRAAERPVLVNPMNSEIEAVGKAEGWDIVTSSGWHSEFGDLTAPLV